MSEREHSNFLKFLRKSRLNLECTLGNIFVLEGVGTTLDEFELGQPGKSLIRMSRKIYE